MEKLEPDGSWIRSDRDRGRNVRAGGQDMQIGDRLLAAGERVTAGAVALAAAAGRATLSVHRRPRVGVLTSGDELRGPETFDDVGKGRGIPDSNGPMLLAAAAEVGAHGVALGPVRDRTDEIRTRLERARADDLDLLVDRRRGVDGPHGPCSRRPRRDGLRPGFLAGEDPAG